MLLTREELLELLRVSNGTSAYFDLLARANQYARKTFEGHGLLFGQIGLDSQPCPVNCRFCSLAQESFNAANSFEKSAADVDTDVRAFLAGGISDVFLMTTAVYGKEAFLAHGKRVKALLPDNSRLVANVGDFDLAYAKRLHEAGFTGVYHICRLGEGVDTKASPAQRIQTLDAIRNAGLELYYCVEPIRADTSYADIVTEILRSRDYAPPVMAVMGMVPVAGTPLENAAPISRMELAKIAAVTTLGVQPRRGMGVHEPNALCLMAGVNQLYAEIGVNPRDIGNQTEIRRGYTPTALKKMFADMEWSIQ